MYGNHFHQNNPYHILNDICGECGALISDRTCVCNTNVLCQNRGHDSKCTATKSPHLSPENENSICELIHARTQDLKLSFINGAFISPTLILDISNPNSLKSK